MLHKHFKRARRCWRTLTEVPEHFDDRSCNRAIADWAREFGEPLIKEVERLRTELKISNRKRRGVHADLREEEDDFDRMMDKIRDVIGDLPADPSESVAAYTITMRLGAILDEFAQD